MEDILKKMYEDSYKNIKTEDRVTELHGYWLGKASAIMEVITLIQK